MSSNKRQKLDETTTMSDTTQKPKVNPAVDNFYTFFKLEKLPDTDDAYITAQFQAFMEQLMEHHFAKEGKPKDGYKFNSFGGHFVRLMFDAMCNFKAMKNAF